MQARPVSTTAWPADDAAYGLTDANPFPPPASLQATAFCTLNTEQIKLGVEDAAKRSGLRQLEGRIPRGRHVVTDPGERQRKFAVETGYDIRKDRFLAEPLEAWPSDHPDGKRWYLRLMQGADISLKNLRHGPDLDFWQAMAAEQLVTVERGKLVPLSDGQREPGRRYPGTTVPDVKAGIGRQLRSRAEELFTVALANLTRGRSARRSARRKGKFVGEDGIALTAADFAAEMNRVKSRRPDLEGYRFASVSLAGRLIRKMLGLGLAEELVPPRHSRRRRSWITLPRVFSRRLPAAPDGDPPHPG